MNSEQMAHMLDAADSIVHRLEGWAKAYPTDIFREVTQAEIDWLHETKPGLIDRISASMGRHMAGCIQEDIAKLRQLISALEQREAGSKGREAISEGLAMRIHYMRRDFDLSTLQRAHFWARECRCIVEALAAAPSGEVGES